MTAGSGTWVPPEPASGRVFWTRSWRLITYNPVSDLAARLYLALAPESLIDGYEAVFPLLDGQGISHRHARSPEALREAEQHPVWAGKAVVIDPPDPALAERLASELDDRLAGLGLSGPSVLAGARPIGGRSGLVFLRRAVEPFDPGDRRQRLVRLLGE